MTPSEIAIIDYLREHGPATFYDLMRLPFREMTLAAAVRRLLEAGMIEEASDGVMVGVRLAYEQQQKRNG